MVCDERAYLQRRALQELSMTLAADCVEAERVHNELTGRYLRACRACRVGKTVECVGCPMAFVCRVSIQPSHVARAA